MSRMFFFTALCFSLACLSEAASASLRVRKGDDDGGDDGGGGGLAGALSGMMGGGGGGEGGDGADNDDDDPNMVGGKKKKAASKGGGGVDLAGLESGLKTGGVGGLMGMLNAMRAAQGHSDSHIVKGRNGEDMYDFRDLDDAETTRMPLISVTEAPPVMPHVDEVSVPDLPTISLPGKGGQLKGLRKAEAQAAAFRKAGAKAAAHKAASRGKQSYTGGLTVWPPQALAPAAPVAPVTQYMVAPFAPATPYMLPATAASAGSLYQGLAAMKQSMDMLMGQATGGMPTVGQATTDPLVAKIAQMSQSFKQEEDKMEKKVESLESEDASMKRQLDKQARELNSMQGGKGEQKSRKGGKNMGKPANWTQAAEKKQGRSFATKPWEATFKVHLSGKYVHLKQETFTVRVHPEWAPEGAKRFQDLVDGGVLDDTRFFRVMKGFMVQFGIPGSPEVASKWAKMKIQDDPVKKHNYRGMLSFAKSGPNTRTTQMFINYANNDFLDKQGFSPFAEVVGNGMKVVDRIQAKYKQRPNQGKISKNGNSYLLKHFPDLSFVGHVSSTLDASLPVAGLIQDSKTPRRKYRHAGIKTFYHQKVPQGE